MMVKINPCLECSVRGDCCYLSIPIEGYNVILDFKPCEHLDIETGLCKIYETRHEVPHCKIESDIFGCGSLPSKCLLLKNKKENNPKVRVLDIVDKLSPRGIALYNLMNNHPTIWDLYKEEITRCQ